MNIVQLLSGELFSENSFGVGSFLPYLVGRDILRPVSQSGTFEGSKNFFTTLFFCVLGYFTRGKSFEIPNDI